MEKLRHIVHSQDFNRPWIEKDFFPLTDEMEDIFKAGGSDILKGKRMISFFYQPSTRTRMSFELAMDYLGGKVVFSTENAREFSSGAKGETLLDTIRVINQYRPDVIILRYDQAIGSEIAVEVSKVPIINAGDRNPGQHPTQSLLDLWTIQRCRGSIDGLKIAMVGDLTHGRTVRSLSYLLGKFDNITIDFVSPKNLRMGSDVKNYLDRHRVRFVELTDLRQVANKVDVIYQTRVQAECGSFMINPKNFIIDKEIVDMMKPGSIIMHPLPKVDEIEPSVDEHQKAVYLTTQINAGLFTRMALLKMILTPYKQLTCGD